MYVHSDGGRLAAGFRGDAGDCAVRAIAIATGKPYMEVYYALWTENLCKINGRDLKRRGGSPRNGSNLKAIKAYFEKIGWRWTPCMKIGVGCRVHLKKSELPDGTIVARVSKHLCAVINGVIYDNHDPSRNGTRCVYGYWSP